jgi:CHAD domain
LLRDRQDKRDEVRPGLRGPAWTKLQLYLTLWPRTLEETHALEKPIIEHARKVLRKAWKKSAKLGQNLDRLNAEQRHEMRKALKNLRYQTEFFTPLFERRDTRRFIEQLKTLQDVFGYVNDVRMASRLIDVQERRHAGIDAARAAAYTIGRHEAEASHVWHAQGLERPGTLVSILGLMRLTAEIRWFWPDRPPQEFHAWFVGAGAAWGQPARAKHVSTSHLRDPDQDSLGIKKSGGGDVEIKGLISR